MKVLFICGAGLFSGLEKVTLSVMQGLQGAGFHITALMSSWGSEEFARRLREARIPFRRLRIGFISKTLTLRNLWMTLDQGLRLPGLWWGYAALLRRERPRYVVHTNYHHITVLWPFLRPGRELFYLHGIFPPSNFYRAWFSFFGPRLTLIICVSQAVADALQSLGMPSAKLVVVHNGVPLPPAVVMGCAPRPQGAPVRIGIVGQVGAWKGHEVLLTALADLVHRGLAVRCLIFGEGEPSYKAQLVEQIAALRLDNIVEWRGFVKDMAAAYPEIDICVVPTITPDPFPLSAIEPLMFGIPVVASSSGGLPEIIRDGITGFLVQPGDAAELAARLVDLVTDAVRRERMGLAAREHAKCHLTEPVMIERFASVLRGLP